MLVVHCSIDDGIGEAWMSSQFVSRGETMFWRDVVLGRSLFAAKHIRFGNTDDL